MSAKAKSILGWIIPIVAIVFLCIKETEKVAKQNCACAITAFGIYFLATLVYSILPFTIPFFSTLLWAVYMVVVILGIVAAAKDKEADIPVITNLAESIFKKAIEG